MGSAQHDSQGRGPAAGSLPMAPIGGPATRARLLLVINVGWFFLSHRLALAQAARDAGYEVHVACGIDDEEEAQAIESHGLTFHRLDIARSGTAPLRELRLIAHLYSLYRRLRPAVIHHVTIKPVLYGGVICRLTGRARVVHAISGLGYVFGAEGVRGGVLRRLVRALYRVALSGGNMRVIFQNQDDLRAFIDRGLLPPEHAVLIRGSGVDLKCFSPRGEPAEPVQVLLPARMLRDKGVFEFIQAARLLRARGVRARFVLAGGVDQDNPQGIPADELKAAAEAAGVHWLGLRTDMVEMLSATHIVCLPSYREGLPKSLLEAAAMGKPMVATDVPGCREVVLHDRTGLLVPARDAQALADALHDLITDPERRAAMGRAARILCEAEFGVDSVVRQTLEIYRA